MGDDDWDDRASGSVAVEQPSGKTFGSRGRGFTPVFNDNRRVGGGGGGGGYGGGGGGGGGGYGGENRRRNYDDDDGGRGRGRENGFGRGSRENGHGEEGFGGRRGDRGDRGDRYGDRGGDRGDRGGDRGDRGGDRGDRGGDRGDRYGDRGGDRGDRYGDRNDRDRDGDGGDGEGGEEKKRVPIYIPPDPEDANQLFDSCITSGINFDKYDKIDVRVTGDNVPKAINSFEEAGLRSFLVEVIQKCNYTKPTPIQKHSLPIVLSGRDLMACAQTGSGKTAAFLLPIINALLEKKSDGDPDISAAQPQALVVSPTRELAIQIFDEARKFSLGTTLKAAILYGGTGTRHQSEKLNNGCHILVATPGRLIDFVKKGIVVLSAIRFVVLDEADRMLDMGFLPDMETVLTHETMTPLGERQTLMFSATLPEEVQRLAHKFLSNYLYVTVGIVGAACDDVEQRFFAVSKFEKRKKLVELLQEHGCDRTLVFVEQKRTADIIATFLSEKDFPTTSIHGDREQREREEALRDFKRGKMSVLVATAVAARGLDIKNVAHVINFDLPKSVDEYVHRIGRTGRVGNKGLASSFYDDAFDSALATDLVKILTQAKQEIPDFLSSASGGYSGGGSRSNFGGRDFRSNEGGSESAGGGGAADATCEDEEW